ncbi:hypothetical protein GO730_15040 [Spirosoma sp. HMF3257]|uniref:SD-repeat containing protein B domain-containing protein n=1 Tax=Spirosoma telluris TaxID=2183553 RepID=A0A327NMP8_9BACT|nr:hypothetical protein [Spirosoma telluris]RAI75174.1 hypothetical protein HMF3257_14985 [Spirosoma telluris]
MIRPSDLAYLGAAAANIPGQNPKTLRIASEACPVYTSTKVDTTLCNVKVGDKLFLSQIVGACNAPICGGTWTAAQTNVGMTFNQCDLSFTVTGLNGCGKYILSNTGGACGDFTIEVNIDFASVTAPEIAGDQTVCSSTTPTAFSIVTPATGSGAITYQWQKSTVSCSAGFTNITGATSSTYQPSEVSQTTYYRVIASVQGGCSFPLKQCSDTSNCATIKVASALATATPGSCNTATNQYSISGIISLTNAIAGVATITDGTVSTSITIAASATSVAYSMTGLVSDGTSHPVTVSLAGCGSATATYTAPASCTVAPCGLVMTLTPGICASATNTYVLSGSVTATNLPTSGTITITSGAFADRLIPVPAGNASGPISYSGLISNGQAYTVTASFSNTACTPVNQTYTAPASCSVTPVCAMSAAASAGLCASATNAYSASVAITLSNAPAGTITVSLPGSTPIVQVLAANTSSFTAVFAGLVSDGASHTATISLPGCGSTTATFTAPVACSVAPVCSMSAVVTAGICQTATNTFSSTAVVTLSNPTVGILTITNGPASQTFATTAVTTATFTAVFDGITSDGSSRTLTAALSGCGTLTQTYTAPSSCSAIPVCSLSARATAGVCNTATNTYSSTAVVVLTNPTTGTLTIIDGPQSATFATTAGSSATFTVGFTDLVSDGSLHTVQATLSGCSSTTTTYTAPSSCSVAPVCSLSVTVSVGTCATATNTYSATATVTALNPPAGASLSVVTAGRTLVFSTTAISQNTFVATFNGLTSDGVNRPVVVSLPGCGTTSASYTAPASCSVVPVCSVSAVVSTGQCSTATNTFSNTVTVTMTNPSAGTLTVSDGVRSVTVIVPATIGTVTAPAVFNGLVSDGSLHTLTVSLPGCASLATTFSAPVSCTTCSLSITTASLPNGQVGTAYSQTLTASGGTAPLSYSVSVGSLPAGLSLNGTTGVISGTPTSATNASFTILLTDGKACSDAQPLTITTSALPVCSLTATATAGVCNTATNTYTVTGSVSATNATANQSLTISVGSVYTTVALTGNGPVSYTLVGLVSDGLAHTVSVLSSATACGTANVTYTAPLSCSIASAGLGDYVFLDANKDGIQNTGDTPISGVTVILYTNGVASATTVTNASGFYSFTGLTAGISQSYVVGFTPQQVIRPRLLCQVPTKLKTRMLI